MAVKFLKSTNVGTYYRKDEVAGFDRKTEERLIADKLAKEHKVKAPPAPAKTDSKDDPSKSEKKDG